MVGTTGAGMLVLVGTIGVGTTGDTTVGLGTHAGITVGIAGAGTIGDMVIMTRTFMVAGATTLGAMPITAHIMETDIIQMHIQVEELRTVLHEEVAIMLQTM
ncbi:hypothetical protein PK35_15020 [Tamlana nanhaiensis]|uniref:Uncharacterized protein n=1 Tax=Neotamlana nanhaiensis TaxID=1382798 RepID=A0A0D7VY97_9FLAO|nr:hypothetical protein PK35_15020 [Tamlana nanhaiensis]